MNLIRRLAITVWFAALPLSFACDASQAQRVQVEDSRFSIVIPTGWERLNPADPREFPQGSTHLFDLFPQDYRPTDAARRLFIRAAYYPDRVPSAARQRWESLRPYTSELPRIEGLPFWSLYGFSRRVFTVYAPIGSHVVLFHLQAPEDQYERGEQALLSILRSYKDETGDE